MTSGFCYFSSKLEWNTFLKRIHRDRQYNIKNLQVVFEKNLGQKNYYFSNIQC